MHPPTTLLALLAAGAPLLARAQAASAEPCAFSRRVLTQCGDGPLHNIDPDTGAICDALDCGGGRAPPKTTVPGCPQYSGPLPSTTRYLECWTPTSASVTTSASSVEEGGLGVQTTLPPGDGSNGTPTPTAGGGAGTTTTAVSTNAAGAGGGRGLVGVVAVVVGVVQVVMV
ncbi:hypothetical protein QBC39DRAFT_379990 [Podospora conica]|nr:hypothetical protein QBC39DRAFT_379990 [Schizothecium conicum]